jgi:hypothetical protein
MLTIFFSLFAVINSQLAIPGSQTDEHNCVLDGGYEWCESTQRCQRPWEEDCFVNVDYCSSSNIQGCRMACPEPLCSHDECAMRVENCCDYTCVSNDLPIQECNGACPPPTPCPMPAILPHCRVVQSNIIDHCGCSTGCPTIDCSTHQNIVNEGGSCGGFMPYGMAGVCDEGLECANTMGPMIADAPGTCQPICDTFRDYWGNCVDISCHSWFDGCNTCDISDNTLTGCTEEMCMKRGESHCVEEKNGIPLNCLTWYDGCNTCSVENGNIGACSLMYCFTQNEPHCETFTTEGLNIGDICSRFCEDMSQSYIDRIDDCPDGSSCISQSLSEISFDTCGNRAYRCIPYNGH